MGGFSTTFIHADKVKTKSESINYNIVDSFIESFNMLFEDRDDNGRGVFVINAGLTSIGIPNAVEFDYCCKLAKEQGWELTKKEDNYQSISYSMKKL